MTEDEFKAQWQLDTPKYDAWGDLVVNTITNALSNKSIDVSSFLKIPPKHRLKSDASLIDKAFYREKEYRDPYKEIEDKVGARFVVLLLDDIDVIRDVIEHCPLWSYVSSRHFTEDKEREPLLFTYQSVHYVLRPKEKLIARDLELTDDISCEVQIRTLLQHAHAELTHDAIYKSNKKIKSNILRTVAKSMALIETTDEFFINVTSELKQGPLSELGIVGKLDSLYFSGTGLTPVNQKSSLIIWDEFEDLINDDLIENIHNFLCKNEYVWVLIQDGYIKNIMYRQSISLFVIWMLKTKKRRLLESWPLSKKMLIPLATDLGINISTV